MNDARVSHEVIRGCGYRKVGGLYLVGPPDGFACGRLPLPLTKCAACGAGIKQARGWTWVQPVKLLGPSNDVPCEPVACRSCPLGGSIPARAGLLWVGAGYYPTPRAFLLEGMRLGFSKRLAGVPRDFELGVTWVLLAHPQAVTLFGGETAPGIFAVWRPTGLERVVSDEDSQAEVDEWRLRGQEPVVVVPVPTQPELREDEHGTR